MSKYLIKNAEELLLSKVSIWAIPAETAGTVEPVLSDPWFGRPLVLGDHNPRHGSFLTVKYLA